jgi:Dyp-type peroxidase family
MADSLTPQEGIYYQRGVRPPGFFVLLLLGTTENQSAASARKLLARLWKLYRQLKDGLVPDLPGVRVPSGNLAVLLGFGAAAFDLHGAQQCPLGLENFAFAEMKGGGPIAVSGVGEAGICYAEEPSTDLAGVAFAVQLTAETPLAVERAVVETGRLLREAELQSGEAAALEIVRFYAGAQRDDGRSWIGFHDGLSNLSPNERAGAIFISATRPEDAWTRNGTYLAFLRLGIALDDWWTFDRAKQERLVGRDKLTGCPIVSFDDGIGKAAVGCPFEGRAITAGDNPFREAQVWPRYRTGMGLDAIATISHVQRVNHHREPADDPASLRIFRQGYPFLEACDESPHFRAGLNFVSFQETPSRLIDILTSDGWLGRTNFGGPDSQHAASTDAARTLLKAYAAGIFLVPPRAKGERFPGAGALGDVRVP